MQGHQSCDELDHVPRESRLTRAELLNDVAIDQDLYSESDVQACQTPGFLHEGRVLRRTPVMYRDAEMCVGLQRANVCSQYR